MHATSQKGHFPRVDHCASYESQGAIGHDLNPLDCGSHKLGPTQRTRIQRRGGERPAGVPESIHCGVILVETTHLEGGKVFGGPPRAHYTSEGSPRNGKKRSVLGWRAASLSPEGGYF